MKRLFNKLGFSAMALGLVLLFGLPAIKATAQGGDDYGYYDDDQQDGNVSMQDFYDDLSPYGQWIEDPQYGSVWVPNVESDFRPYYSDGHWVLTEYGNMWVSDYPWGWAAFHYGRWTYDPYYGWVWIPDTQWGPAWVDWRDGGGYYGWAPMGPGMSIGVSFGYTPYDWWTFIPYGQLYNPRFHHYYRGSRYNRTIINQTTVINNTYSHNRHSFVYGPRRNEFETRTGQRPTLYNIRGVNRPQPSSIRGNTVNIYRPSILGNRGNARPSNVIRAERPISGRPASATSTPQRFSQPNRGLIAPSQRPMRAEQARPQQNFDRPQRGFDRPQQVQPARPQQFDQPRPQQNFDRPQRGFDRPQPVQQARPQQYEQPRPQQNFDRPRPMQEARPQQFNRPQPVQQARPQQFEQPRPQQNFDRPRPMQESRPQQFNQPVRPMPQQQHFEQPRPQPQMQGRPEPQMQGRPAGGEIHRGR